MFWLKIKKRRKTDSWANNVKFIDFHDFYNDDNDENDAIRTIEQKYEPAKLNTINTVSCEEYSDDRISYVITFKDGSTDEVFYKN